MYPHFPKQPKQQWDFHIEKDVRSKQALQSLSHEKSSPLTGGYKLSVLLDWHKTTFFLVFNSNSVEFPACSELFRRVWRSKRFLIAVHICFALRESFPCSRLSSGSKSPVTAHALRSLHAHFLRYVGSSFSLGGSSSTKATKVTKCQYQHAFLISYGIVLIRQLFDFQRVWWSLHGKYWSRRRSAELTTNFKLTTPTPRAVVLHQRSELVIRKSVLVPAASSR